MERTVMDSSVLTIYQSKRKYFPKFFSDFRKVVVVGAGYIAVELAAILAELGSETYLLIRFDKVLRTFDETLSEALTNQLKQGPVKLMTHTKVSYLLNPFSKFPN